mmetsp:Transcript_23576/g.26202  ORF Transcript_23576/g.26202 Transcript_23576/m.26202 type:complete len:106 (+) Transcript_23576:121-438(+)
MLEKIISLGCHLEGLEFHFCFIDTENISLNPTRVFKIKYLRFYLIELPKNSLLSDEDYIRHIMLAINNCSLKDSLEDFAVYGDDEHDINIKGFKYKKGGSFSWTS